MSYSISSRQVNTQLSDTIPLERWQISLNAISVGQRIKEVRLRRKVKQKQLAESIGVHPSVLSRLEAGKIKPNLVILEKIAKALSIRFIQLFLDEKDSEKLKLFCGDEEVIGFVDQFCALSPERRGEVMRYIRFLQYEQSEIS